MPVFTPALIGLAFPGASVFVASATCQPVKRKPKDKKK